MGTRLWSGEQSRIFPYSSHLHLVFFFFRFFFWPGFRKAFWMLLGYTVAKAPTNPRNSIWFTKLFLLVRGWGLGTRLVTKQLGYSRSRHMTNKMAQKWLTLIGICSFCLLSFHLAIKGQFVSYFLSVMLLCITYKILILVMDFGHFMAKFYLQHFDYTLIILQRFNYSLIIFSLKMRARRWNKSNQWSFASLLVFWQHTWLFLIPFGS